MCDICRHSPCDLKCPNSNSIYAPPTCICCGAPAAYLLGNHPYCADCVDVAIYGEACAEDTEEYIKSDLADFAAWMVHTGRTKPKHLQEDL